MLEDALLDLTNRGDMVIDPFLGSGSSLIAAESTGRSLPAASSSTPSMST
jgi:DNA modification methylase